MTDSNQKQFSPIDRLTDEERRLITGFRLMGAESQRMLLVMAYGTIAKAESLKKSCVIDLSSRRS